MFKLKYLFFPFEEIKDQEYLASLKEGGVKEPRVFRDLTDNEKVELESSFRFSLQVKNNFWWIILVSLIADIVFVYSTFRFVSNISDNIFYEVFTGGLFLILIFFQIFFWKVASAENEKYFDLKSPVYKVQGKAIIKISDEGAVNSAIMSSLTVRNIKFDSSHAINLIEAIEKIKPGEEIAIEYSPRTKHIWKIYKAEN